MSSMSVDGAERSYESEAAEPAWDECASQESMVQAEASRRFGDLSRLIESQIIPRLMLAHDLAESRVSGPRLPAGIDPGAVEALARIVVEKDIDAAFAYVDRIRDGGVSLEIIYLDLLGPTARFLGEMWEKDLNYFSDVAVGLSRLHHLVRELSPDFQNESKSEELGRQALIMPMPGEAHTFGLVLVVEFFRRAGWDVWGWPMSMGSDLLTTVKNEKFDLVGISVSCDSSIGSLTDIIASIRKLSRNRAVRVMVGGPLFLRRPELVAIVGADATARDGHESVLRAEALVESKHAAHV